MDDSSISLPDDVRADLDAAANAGGYANSTDLIRDLLADYQARRNQLADLLEEGERSGFVEYSMQDILAEARARYDAG